MWKNCFQHLVFVVFFFICCFFFPSSMCVSENKVGIFLLPFSLFNNNNLDLEIFSLSFIALINVFIFWQWKLIEEKNGKYKIFSTERECFLQPPPHIIPFFLFLCLCFCRQIFSLSSFAFLNFFSHSIKRRH